MLIRTRPRGGMVAAQDEIVRRPRVPQPRPCPDLTFELPRRPRRVAVHDLQLQRLRPCRRRRRLATLDMLTRALPVCRQGGGSSEACDHRRDASALGAVSRKRGTLRHEARTHVARRTSHVARRTSHVARRTSHVAHPWRSHAGRRCCTSSSAAAGPGAPDVLEVSTQVEPVAEGPSTVDTLEPMERRPLAHGDGATATVGEVAVGGQLRGGRVERDGRPRDGTGRASRRDASGRL